MNETKGKNNLTKDQEFALQFGGFMIERLDDTPTKIVL